MTRQLDGKTAIVYGAGGDIGAGVARARVRSGGNSRQQYRRNVVSPTARPRSSRRRWCTVVAVLVPSISAMAARIGGADPEGGTGLRGLADRVAVLGGDRPRDQFSRRRYHHRGRSPVRVILADDSALFREGVARILTDAGVEVSGQARDGQELLRLVRAAPPDVVVVDIRMPPTGTDEGLSAARAIRTEHPEVGVLVLSAYVDTDFTLTLASKSPDRSGYLLKDRGADGDELVEAIRRIGNGGLVIDPAVVARLGALPRERNPVDASGRSSPSSASSWRPTTTGGCWPCSPSSTAPDCLPPGRSRPRAGVVQSSAAPGDSVPVPVELRASTDARETRRGYARPAMGRAGRPSGRTGRMRGSNVEQVQQMLEHSSATVTLDTTSHVFPALAEQLPDPLDAAYLDALPKEDVPYCVP